MSSICIALLKTKLMSLPSESDMITCMFGGCVLESKNGRICQTSGLKQKVNLVKVDTGNSMKKKKLTR